MRRSGAVQVRLRYKVLRTRRPQKPQRDLFSASSAHSVPRGGSLRVLVVEDEARLSRQLASALAEAGYAVDTAGDGERADFLAQTERYDAVVLDLGLPKIDGLTLLHRWR